MKVFKRIELHNHTVESDGSLKASELVDFFLENGINSFSLTDHNTVSGFIDLDEYKKEKPDFEYVKGYELTSYHGHILCHNIGGYIAWDDIDVQDCDKLLDRVHTDGGVVGLAHPKHFSQPIANGTRFMMEINDYNKLDFIEIVNFGTPNFPCNYDAIKMWEELVFKGYKIAPTAGLDLHVKKDLTGAHKTYMELPTSYEEKTLAEQLDYAIKNRKTLVSCGPLIFTEIVDGNVKISLKNEDLMPYEDCYVQLKTKSKTILQKYTKSEKISLPISDFSAIIYVYETQKTANELPLAVKLLVE